MGKKKPPQRRFYKLDKIKCYFFLAAVFFLAAAFLGAAFFLAAAFLGAAFFLAAAFLGAAFFLAAAFLVAAFLAAAFLGAAFLVAAFLEAAFLAAAFAIVLEFNRLVNGLSSVKLLKFNISPNFFSTSYQEFSIGYPHLHLCDMRKEKHW